MRSSPNRWFERLTLVVILALIAVTAHSFLTARYSSLLAAIAHPTSGPDGTTQGPTALPTATPTATPTSTPTSTSTPTPTDTPTSTPTATPTTTATPPRPTVTPTGTPTPEPTQAFQREPTPLAVPPGLPMPAPVVITRTGSTSRTLGAPDPLPLVNQPQNVINVLLLGSDQVGIDRVGRTDTIVIAAIHPDIPSVSLLSIPRDFYAWMPGYGFGKINTAFSRGGPALAKATIRYNFGVEIDYYARVGFDSFVKIVDALGGVTVPVECPLHDIFPDPHSPSGQTAIDLEPGIHHLDGKHALWYTRSRWSTSDFDRHRRQQQVLRSLYSQVRSVGVIPKIPSLWGALSETVSTDIDVSGMVRLGAIGLRLDAGNVKSRFVGGGAVESWRDPDGLYILVPDREVLQSVVAEGVMPPAPSQQQAFLVEVVNGTPNDGWGHVAAERLRWEGFGVLRVERAGEIQPRTQIVDFRTTPDNWTRYRLTRLYGLESDDVVSHPDEESDVHFRIVLGAQYDPCTAVRGR